MAARLLPWLMFITALFWLIAAWPATTWPPVGNCVGTGGAACAKPMLNNARASGLNPKALATPPPVRELARLPRALAISATATKVQVISFQITR